MMECCPVFSGQLPAGPDEVAQNAAVIAAVSVPAPASWISGRVATLLAHYWTPSMGDALQTAVAEDWLDELEGFPGWALHRACQWWASHDNHDRRRKPLPGDIAARARHEFGAVRLAEQRNRVPAAALPPKEIISSDRAAEIMAEVGFEGPTDYAPRTMPREEIG